MLTVCSLKAIINKDTMKAKLLATLSIIALSITPSFAAINLTFSYN